MKRYACGAAFIVACAASRPAYADESVQNAFTHAPVAAPVADATLRVQRGHYVLSPLTPTAGVPGAAPAHPVVESRATAASAVSASAASAAPAASGASSAPAAPITSAASASNVSTPAAAGGAGGRVVYFGFDLSSVWTTKGAGGATTYAAGENVGVDLSGARPAITLQKWTAKNGNGNDAATTGNSVSGTLDGRINGIAQTIQIAGNANTVTNGAGVDIGSVRPVLVVGPANGTTCGAACSVRADPNALGVAIDLPGGSVSQGIAGGSLYQHVRLNSDGNAVANQLKLSLQIAPPGGHAVVAPLNLLPSTLQLVR